MSIHTRAPVRCHVTWINREPVMLNISRRDVGIGAGLGLKYRMSRAQVVSAVP
jgi:hypothetical protein